MKPSHTLAELLSGRLSEPERSSLTHNLPQFWLVKAMGDEPLQCFVWYLCDFPVYWRAEQKRREQERKDRQNARHRGPLPLRLDNRPAWVRNFYRLQI